MLTEDLRHPKCGTGAVALCWCLGTGQSGTQHPEGCLVLSFTEVEAAHSRVQGHAELRPLANKEGILPLLLPNSAWEHMLHCWGRVGYTCILLGESTFMCTFGDKPPKPNPSKSKACCASLERIMPSLVTEPHRQSLVTTLPLTQRVAETSTLPSPKQLLHNQAYRKFILRDFLTSPCLRQTHTESFFASIPIPYGYTPIPP